MENRQVSSNIHNRKHNNDKTHVSGELKPRHQKVLIRIKPKAPILKTLYIAEKNKFIQQKTCDRSGSSLGIGDHSSDVSSYTFENTTIVSEINSSYTCINHLKSVKDNKDNTTNEKVESSSTATENSDIEIFQDSLKYIKKLECSAYSHIPQITMNIPKIENKIFKSNVAKKVINTTPVEKLEVSSISSVVQNICKKINYLEEKIVEQEMVLHSIHQHLNFSSSDEETSYKKKDKPPSNDLPGCSYIEYSHIPETSAFQRQSQQSPFCHSKATTMEKAHNSEQYGRDYTLYDNMTAKARRQSASVPCKRNDISKHGAERVHKIRHKLNPVRDYRLMDTVHYLAQGEFAPRDDGIKLTPSREAVLSDIIWEDVCRTHWPNTRLARRAMHTERCNTRSDLQSLIDSLLRERVAHIERRKRRHYRVVKLNHRHETCKPLGKIGDVIVASNKSNQNREDQNCLSDNENFSEQMRSRSKKSKDRVMKTKQGSRHNECSPGPSSAIYKESTCCYHTKNTKTDKTFEADSGIQNKFQELSSTSSINSKSPRYVVKKNSSHRKYRCNEPNLEHFILLPTLVVRTPSNVRRQKKFNELYQRILNVQMKKDQIDGMTRTANDTPNVTKRDVGLNINLTLSESEEKLNNH